MQVKDEWGTLVVTDGAIVAADFSSVTVAAPASPVGQKLQGPGWTLQLAEGWHLARASQAGNFILEHK